jgi:hypothetical protein
VKTKENVQINPANEKKCGKVQGNKQVKFSRLLIKSIVKQEKCSETFNRDKVLS